MIPEYILHSYTKKQIFMMTPEKLARSMIRDDSEFNQWWTAYGRDKSIKMGILQCKIYELQKEIKDYEEEYNEQERKALERLIPIAEKDLLAFLDEYADELKEEDKKNDQNLSEETCKD